MRLLLLIITLLSSLSAHAIYIELGLAYNYKKTVLDQVNYSENQSTTGSIDFYFWERVAIEFSYTNSLYVKQEPQYNPLNNNQKRTITQYADIYGTDLMFLFADKKDRFQPFIKGGVAYIKKKQTVLIEGDQSYDVSPKPGYAPSYGAGLKYFITESLAFRASWDVNQTPIDDNTKANDLSGRVGLSWMF
jgi:opacity protein-like surface antigen